jgi:hypothetical protein
LYEGASLKSVLSDKDDEDPNFVCVLEALSAFGETGPAARDFAPGFNRDQASRVSHR